MRNPLTPITPPRRMHSMVAAKIALADTVAMRFPKKIVPHSCYTSLKTAQWHTYLPQIGMTINSGPTAHQR